MDESRHLNLLLEFVPTTEYQRQIWLGVSRYCHSHRDFRCRTASTEANLMEDNDVIDGIIAIVSSGESVERLTRLGKPIVNVSSILYPTPFPTVAIDNLAIGNLAAEHLITQGYQFFAYHMESRVYFSVQRGKGFSEFLREKKQETHVFDTGAHCASPPEELHALTIDWLRQLPKPLGLFTHNDQRAAVLIDICHDAGLKVPEEVGIIGVDNDPLLADCCKPSLTSVDGGASAAGYCAAELLGQIISGQIADHRPTFLPPKAVKFRESTQPHILLDDRLAAAMRYINGHCDQPLGVEELLGAVQISRRSLERLFQSHLGRSPAEEIRRSQMNHVKWLLMEQRLPISDIARSIGFSSLNSFTSAFRKETGLSATAYRKRFSSSK